MNPKSLQYFLGVMLLIFGLVVTLQIKSVQVEANLNNRQKNLHKLQESLASEQKKNAELKAQLGAQSKKLEAYESSAKRHEVSVSAAELDNARLLAGLTDVSGPGVIITLSDAKRGVIEDENAKDLLIHDTDILRLLDYLKGSGAQAIAVNGERVVAVTETQCAGPTISVNHIRSTVPFVVKAIGNADYLEAKLNEWDSVVGLLKVRGLEVDVKKSDKINIPKYRNLFTS